MIDWESSDADILLNPRLPENLKAYYHKHLSQQAFSYKRHVWLATSGSTEKIKFVCLSKEALIISAEAVNRRLESTRRDIWLNPLPIYHVGGLSIWARSNLSKAKVVSFEQKWKPAHYCQAAEEARATLSSLVPTQVFDLVSAHLQAPKSLRAIFVGGGALSETVYKEAIDLGWPLLPSYGLTECSSQVATAVHHSLQLKLLPHVEARINEEGLICLKSRSLLTAYAFPDEKGWEIHDPKTDGWFATQDRGFLSPEGILQMTGRHNDQIKIGGEFISLFQLEKILEKARLSLQFPKKAVLVVLPDERLEHVVHLAAEGESKEEFHPLVGEFNREVLPFERIREIHLFSKLPVSPLNKPLNSQIYNQIICKKTARNPRTE